MYLPFGVYSYLSREAVSRRSRPFTRRLLHTGAVYTAKYVVYQANISILCSGMCKACRIIPIMCRKSNTKRLMSAMLRATRPSGEIAASRGLIGLHTHECEPGTTARSPMTSSLSLQQPSYSLNYRPGLEQCFASSSQAQTISGTGRCRIIGGMRRGASPYWLPATTPVWLSPATTSRRQRRCTWIAVEYRSHVVL